MGGPSRYSAWREGIECLSVHGGRRGHEGDCVYLEYHTWEIQLSWLRKVRGEKRVNSKRDPYQCFFLEGRRILRHLWCLIKYGDFIGRRESAAHPIDRAKKETDTGREIYQSSGAQII